MPRRYWVIAISVGGLVIIGWFVWQYGISPSLQQKTALAGHTQSNPELERTYEGQAHDIIAPVLAQHQLGQAKESLLAVRVPAKYVDLHLSLVLALDLIEQGSSANDQKKIDQGFTQLDRLAIQNTWLK